MVDQTVQRYRCEGSYGEPLMEEASNGEYVLYQDYQKLEKRYQRAISQNNAMRLAVTKAYNVTKSAVDFVNNTDSCVRGLNITEMVFDEYTKIND